MTSTEIAKKIGQTPKDVIAYIQANATFPVRTNFQTGDIIVPDDVDISTFFAPMIDKQVQAQIEKEKQALEQKAQQERMAAAMKLQQDRMAVAMKIQQEDKEQREAEQQNSVSVGKLKQMGAEGYYQYKVISLMDVGGLFRSNSGRVNTETMTQTLNELGMDGWHLVTAYSNELGKNALSGGVGGVLLGTNSTVDENILIFERYVKF